MKIGLASYEFRNNDVAFNISQMEKAMKSAQGKADLLCFGETFLQGFDALSWNYEADKDIAVSADSEVMKRLCGMTVRYGTDLLFGYIEKCGDVLYSSCALMEAGKLAYNYRRISKGWKEYSITDEHYAEGCDTCEILYRGQRVQIALCGDMWEYPERFQTEGILIWPVYVNFELDEWARYEGEYAAQSLLAARKTLMVNPLSQEPRSHGGAFCFADGEVQEKLSCDTEGILIVEV